MGIFWTIVLVLLVSILYTAVGYYISLLFADYVFDDKVTQLIAWALWPTLFAFVALLLNLCLLGLIILVFVWVFAKAAEDLIYIIKLTVNKIFKR